MTDREPITEEWLRCVGFKWHQFDRQSEKHWLLWLGDALVDNKGERQADGEDLGVEVSGGSSIDSAAWFCWIRSDSAGRYHRFIHVRHLWFRDELISMIEGLTGQKWEPTNNWYGFMRTPKRSELLKREQLRADLRALHQRMPWYESEKDPDRGKALPEHQDASIKAGLCK